MSDIGGGVLYNDFQCIMGIGHMGPPIPREQTDTSENIIFPQLRWWAVTTVIYSCQLCG